MTTYAIYERKVNPSLSSDQRSQDLTPTLMTTEQHDTIQKILEIKAKMKELAEAKEFLLHKLPRQTPMVGKVLVRDEDRVPVSQTMTFIVDRPAGNYVKFPELDFTMECKTTKADLKVLGIEG